VAVAVSLSGSCVQVLIALPTEQLGRVAGCLVAVLVDHDESIRRDAQTALSRLTVEELLPHVSVMMMMIMMTMLMMIMAPHLRMRMMRVTMMIMMVVVVVIRALSEHDESLLKCVPVSGLSSQ
jgi:hypothetical protein